MTDTAIESRLSLLEQAWALQRSGDMSAIVQLLAPVPVVDLLAEPELGVILGLGYYHCGQGTRALDLVQALYEPVRKQGNSRLNRRLQNLHAMLLLSQGALPPAERLWAGLQQLSDAAGDILTLSWAYANLAVVADIQCRWEDAQANSRRAAAAFWRLGDLRGIARSHHTMGMTYRQLGRLHEADASFERAAAYLRHGGTVDEIAYTELERGLTLYMLRDASLAKVNVQRAQERFSRLAHVRGEGDSLRVLAIFARYERRLDDARGLLESALTCVRKAGDRLTEAEVLEEQAVLEKLEGNADGSTHRAGEAAVIYRAVGADRRAERMEERLRGVAAGTGAVPGED